MIDIKRLKTLRQESGVSFALCKKALEEANNDLEKAKLLLKKWGAEKVESKKSHTTSYGVITSYVHHNKKIASLVELLCETDFVSGNSEFQNLGQELAMQVASLNPTSNKEFLEGEYIRDPSKKVGDLIKDAVLKFGENIKVGRFVRWSMDK